MRAVHDTLTHSTVLTPDRFKAVISTSCDLEYVLYVVVLFILHIYLLHVSRLNEDLAD